MVDLTLFLFIINIKLFDKKTKSYFLSNKLKIYSKPFHKEQCSTNHNY